MSCSSDSQGAGRQGEALTEGEEFPGRSPWLFRAAIITVLALASVGGDPDQPNDLVGVEEYPPRQHVLAGTWLHQPGRVGMEGLLQALVSPRPCWRTPASPTDRSVLQQDRWPLALEVSRPDPGSDHPCRSATADLSRRNNPVHHRRRRVRIAIPDAELVQAGQPRLLVLGRMDQRND